VLQVSNQDLNSSGTDLSKNFNSGLYVLSDVSQGYEMDQIAGNVLFMVKVDGFSKPDDLATCRLYS